MERNRVAKEIHKARKEDHKKRDFGHGVKPLNESGSRPTNEYDGPKFVKIKANLKESEFRPTEVLTEEEVLKDAERNLSSSSTGESIDTNVKNNNVESSSTNV